jgi:hypothetical protein
VNHVKKPRTRKSNICPYCCLRPATTRDHVVPRCLFPRTLPNGTFLPTIKACAICNGTAKSQHDTFLRDYLVLQSKMSSHGVAKELLDGPVKRSLARGQSRFVKTLRNARLAENFTPSGIYLGQTVVAGVDEKRLHNALAKITRGLCFLQSRRLLPINAIFAIRRLNLSDVRGVIELSKKWYFPPALVGDVFFCTYAVGDVAEHESLWIMTFYDRVCFSIHTHLPDRAKARDRPVKPK